MAFALSPVRTVLWDQIQYSGDPSEFSWVLPVGPGSYIEASSDAWFEALDTASTIQVEAPPLNCPGGGGGSSGFGCACGGMSAMSDSTSAAGRDGVFLPSVFVVHEGTVGPYQTVTLRSTDPGALRNYLDSNGYEVPDDVAPVIDAYVAEGSDFIALKLRPGVGVRAMTPVRVVTPGASPRLPLRMVAAGTGDHVAITLFVIAEGRYGTQNFPEARVDPSKLSWDFNMAKSNYGKLRDDALATGTGNGFLTSFALKGLRSTIPTPNSGPASFQVSGSSTFASIQDIADLYFAQAAANENRSTPSSCSPDLALSRSLVVDTCPLPAGAAGPSGSAGAGDAGRTAPCPAVKLDEIAAQDLACQNWTDLEAALIGMHPSDAWVTRLEANLPHAALAEDLVLAPAASQTAVSSWFVAKVGENAPCALASLTTPAEGVRKAREGLAASSQAGLGLASVFGFWLARRGTRERRGRGHRGGMGAG
jgi:hypothetical protein